MQERFISDLNQLEKGARIALYGAGAVGKYFLDQSEKTKHVKVVCFIDDQKKGERFGLPVIDPSQLDSFQPDLVLITTSYWREVRLKLQEVKWNSFAIGDPFFEEEKTEITICPARGTELKFHTPSRVLRFIADAFETIEPKTLDWIDSFSAGETMYDIGASNGMFAVYAAVKKNCCVVAFEPDAQNFSVLEMNHFLNNKKISTPIISLNVAASDKYDLGSFHAVNYGAGHHNKTLEKNSDLHTAYAHTQMVLTASLDKLITDFNLPEPDHVKIDVDGAEWNVMQGAAGRLASGKVRSWLIELREGTQEAENIFNLMQKNNYEMKERQKIAEIIGPPVEGVYNFLFLKKDEH
ncbi:MAG: FkbM family methyltransferase [Bacteroidetes bacterium]|nr:FkbM family methyltransferase [Bacteroidota bacterium]